MIVTTRSRLLYVNSGRPGTTPKLAEAATRAEIDADVYKTLHPVTAPELFSFGTRHPGR
jgi:hypothetical protein